MLYQLSYSRPEIGIDPGFASIPAARARSFAPAIRMYVLVAGDGFEPSKASADRFTVCSL